ncbi:protein LEG1 homolog [Corythoichthys intestinalis]|uniref:protein LEG1 homolog n=1 Tax=Corythoichthys intestinalis TaxID=161448 RepID=UPI0025A59D0C|nr:protein LEG1 homolog [Corythoichthys intestinalis]
MQRLTASCLLLAMVASVAYSAVILDNGAPIKWADSAAQLTDLPVENGILNPNPWNFVHRMGFYRLLIAATDPYMGSMGTGATESPLWGLPLQFGWMQTSGRLADPTGATTCGLPTGDLTCISPQSWWGCVNHFVSVLPFLSAAQQGLFGPGVQVIMQVPEGSEGYCTNYADCTTSYADVMAKWDAFFQGLKASTESTLPDNEKKDAILGLYWAAHMASLHEAKNCKDKQSHYSGPEVNFASSWLNSAEYVSAANFQSSLDKSIMFLTPLPGRVLKDGDSAPNIADLSQEENHTLSVFSWMKSMDTILLGSLSGMWRSAMCSVTTREKGREMLEQLLLNPSYATNTFLSIITEMTTSC